MTRKILFAAAILALVTVGMFACDMGFTLTDAAGNTRSVVPGDPVDLTQGETYSLLVTFTENHGRCTVGAEETAFLLDGQRWQESADHLPMQLLHTPVWEDTDSKSHETTLEFTAVATGEWELEVVRKCDKKGGYDEYLAFTIQ